MFGDSRSLRFSCVDFGWRTFLFTEVWYEKETSTHDFIARLRDNLRFRVDSLR